MGKLTPGVRVKHVHIDPVIQAEGVIISVTMMLDPNPNVPTAAIGALWAALGLLQQAKADREKLYA
ncbi:MAG: hypothetical protein J0H79_14035 [Alphaproteobacteria bacterium]|nr:hypothetical protein [Alphaproteobacteria bacterium]